MDWRRREHAKSQKAKKKHFSTDPGAAAGRRARRLVAVIRTAHDQQRAGHKNVILGVFNAICKIYTTIIRGTPMMVQLLIMSLVIFASSRNYTMIGILALGINSGAYVSEIVRSGLMSVDPGQMEAGRSLGLNYMTTMVVIIIPRPSGRCCLPWAMSSSSFSRIPRSSPLLAARSCCTPHRAL